MDLFKSAIDIFFHLDKHLTTVISQLGVVTYLLLFAIIFLETGVVVTPFLPGDSLLFAAGALSATGGLHVGILFMLLCIAAVLGDTLNYWIGYRVGPKVFHMKKIPFLKKEHLTRTEKFYEKHGGKTIILARFIPIIRTFAPFVAGVGKMSYGKFLSFNVIGGITWVTLFVWGGYFFGNLPIVKENFHYAIVAIILISILPAVIEYIKHKREHLKDKLEIELD